jgi:formylglycine-generating enzyme
VCHTDCDNHPQVCVDWCDAYAYCTAVGKKLCDSLEDGLPSTDLDPLTDAWANACTAGGANDYTAGASDGDCNTSSGGGTSEVGSIAACQSTVAGYTGVYDLTGNVQEWIDGCDGNMQPTDHCIAAGGSFDDDSPYTMCIYPQAWVRLDHRYVVGIRCCEL